MIENQENLPSRESKTKGALCYFPFIGWIISVFFILTEREDHYVRFNAVQSLLLLLIFVAVSIFLDVLSSLLSEIILADLVLGLTKSFIPAAYMVLSILLIYKSYLGEKVLLPRLGGTAQKHM